MNPSLELQQNRSQNTSMPKIKINLQRNFSTKQQKINRGILEPKSPRKLNNKKKANQDSYIAKALANIQRDCIDEKTGLIKIDGEYGDYRMKVFRNKDRVKHYNDPSSIFNDKEFVQKIWDYANCGTGKNQQQSKQILSQSTEDPSSPKKGIRNERARLGMRRQNSIISPGLKQNELQKIQQKLNKPSQQQSRQLSEKLSQILQKPRDYYLYQPVENVEQEEEKNQLRKGIEQELRQKEGCLFYRSIPQYMAEKWFKTVDNSTPEGNYVTPYVEQKPVLPPSKKPGYKRTHLFRFLERNCSFNANKQNKSMSAY